MSHDDLIAELRGHHGPLSDGSDPEHCYFCETRMPCSSLRAADAIEHLQQTCDTLLEGQADADYHDRMRDQLLAERDAALARVEALCDAVHTKGSWVSERCGIEVRDIRAALIDPE